MITKRNMLILAAMGALATGCTTVADQEFLGYQDPGFGEANRATFAAMVVHPDPQYENPIPSTSAEHAAQVLEDDVAAEGRAAPQQPADPRDGRRHRQGQRDCRRRRRAVRERNADVRDAMGRSIPAGPFAQRIIFDIF